MPMTSGFTEVAPYLEDPLVLSGFALFLFFGALRLLVKRLPVVTKKIAGIAVLRLVTFGFVLAIVVIVLGFGLRFMEVQSDAARIASEHRAQLAEQANKTLQRELARRVKDLNTAREQSKALTEAVTALAQRKGSSIDAALKALAKNNPIKAKAIFRQIIEDKAVNIREAATAQRHLGALAFLYNTQEALIAYRRATQLDPKNASGWNQLGRLYSRTGQLDEAIKAYRKVLEIGEADGSQVLVATGYGNLGNVYKVRGELDRAETMHKKALAINEQLGSKEGMAINYGNLGNVYQIRGELDRSETMHKKALAINEQLGSKEGMAINYENLGNVYRVRGELDRAETAWRKSLALFRSIGSPKADRVQGLLNNIKNRRRDKN